MAIFERLGDLIKSNINDLLDKAENPEKMVKQIIIDMQEELEKCTSALGQAMGSQRSMKKNMDAALSESASWEGKAKMALQAGNTDLAKQALEKKVNSDKQAEQYRIMYEQATSQVDTIKNQVEALKMKLDEAKSRQNMLIARSKMADAQQSMAKTLGNMDSNSAFAKLDKMEEKIAQKESTAEAFSELAGTSNAPDAFAELEKNNAVDSELERLKQEMGL